MLRRWVAGPSVAVDLGTAWSRAQACGDPIVSTRRSVVQDGAGVAPALRAGVVHDAAATTAVAKALLAGMPRWGWRGPRVLACVPSDACEAERQALRAAVTSAGADAVMLLDEAFAAAIGAGADLGSGFAQMVVDVGEGVTEASVVDRSGVVATAAVRVGCAALRAEVRDALRRGERPADDVAAERLLREHGVAVDPSPAAEAGDHRRLVHAAVAQPTAAIAACAAGLLRGLDDRHACEVIDGGIVLTGGGALLPGMRALIEHATRLTTRVAADPLHAVIHGAHAVLREAARYGLWDDGDGADWPSR